VKSEASTGVYKLIAGKMRVGMVLSESNAEKRGTGSVPDRALRMEAIVDQHETALLRYAGRIVNDPTSAQDVVQNVFIKLFRHWNGQAPAENMKGWLFRVAHNEAVDHVRRESRLHTLHQHHAEERSDDAAPAANDTEERKSQVLRHLSQLTPPEQQVVLLRMQEGMSYREIAQITGRSEGNIGNILHHAVKKLAEAVK
jgi:RNA polymerase sigma-70 factor (ECF subfamily)